MKFDIKRTYPNELGSTQQCAQFMMMQYFATLPYASFNKIPQTRFSFKGFSDLVGSYKGRAVYIEVKAEKGKPTQSQIDFLAEKIKAGAYAGFAKSIRDCIDICTGGFGAEFKGTKNYTAWTRETIIKKKGTL